MGQYSQPPPRDDEYHKPFVNEETNHDDNSWDLIVCNQASWLSQRQTGTYNFSVSTLTTKLK
eukprot:12214051-Ditylum_brightwellii.AAC.1